MSKRDQRQNVVEQYVTFLAGSLENGVFEHGGRLGRSTLAQLNAGDRFSWDRASTSSSLENGVFAHSKGPPSVPDEAGGMMSSEIPTLYFPPVAVKSLGVKCSEKLPLRRIPVPEHRSLSENPVCQLSSAHLCRGNVKICLRLAVRLQHQQANCPVGDHTARGQRPLQDVHGGSISRQLRPCLLIRQARSSQWARSQPPLVIGRITALSYSIVTRWKLDIIVIASPCSRKWHSTRRQAPCR